MFMKKKFVKNVFLPILSKTSPQTFQAARFFLHTYMLLQYRVYKLSWNL